MIFRALNKAGVRYCLIGRLAAALFGLNVHTDDIDILLFRTIPNTRKFFKALVSLKCVARVPPPAELDLFLSSKVTRFNVGGYILDALKWQEGFPLIAWKHVKTFRVHGVKVRVADLHDLIQTKSHTGRRKDMADVRHLRKILEQEKSARRG